MNVYDFTVKDQNGNEIPLSNFKGKVLLIVNTATGCGFTPQYDTLEDIYEEFKEKGFEILDFPCNQFANQAPGSDEEIHSFCTGRYGITFPQFSKIEVNGENAIPLYKWLTGKKSIKWNFTKFLIDKNGNVSARFEPIASLKKVRAKIEEVLS